MNDTDEFFVSSSNYLESLVKCRSLLKDNVTLASKLDDVIFLELDLALMGAEKAKSEILKSNKPTVKGI